MPLGRVSGSWTPAGFVAIARVSVASGVQVLLVPAGQALSAAEITFFSLAEPEPGDIGISSAVMREVRLGDVLAKARRVASDSAEVISGEAAHRVDELLDAWRQPGLRPEPGAPEERSRYAALAAKYVTLLAEGERRPVEVLSKHLRLANGTTNQRIREARRMGLLTAAPSGQAGGQLTPDALSLLGLVIDWGSSPEEESSDG